MKPQYELLDAYIDTLRGAADAEPKADGELDPGLARLAREVDSLARAASPRPGFSAELEARLFGAEALDPRRDGAAAWLGAPRADVAGPAGAREAPPADEPRPLRPFWRVTLLAARLAAALFVVAVLAGLAVAAVTLGRPWLEGRVTPNVATDPRQALVELQFNNVDGRFLQAGVSLGNGRIVTAATWPESFPFDKIEANWGRHVVAEAEVVRVDEASGLALLQTRGALPPALGPAGGLSEGDAVTLLGREGVPFLPAARTEGSDVTSVLSVREAAGEVVATGVALPDPGAIAPPAQPAPGPFVAVRAETWQGLVGGLVLDPAGQPAGLVVQTEIMTSGAPGTAYALPLDEVKRWANTPPPVAAPAGLGKVAFVRDGDIWVKDLPDGEERRLTEDGNNAEPKWSSSGQWLAFRKGEALWVASGDGSGGNSVAPERLDRFAWSPAGDYLAFSADGGLTVVAPDGQVVRAIVPPRDERRGSEVQDVGTFAWSPDGRRIAIASSSQGQAGHASLWWASAEAGTAFAQSLLNRNQESAGAGDFVGAIVAGWSPDGEYILYWTNPLSASLLADGTSLHAISAERREPGVGPIQYEITRGMLASRDLLDWSPDGRRLALADGSSRATWENKTIVLTAPGEDMRRVSEEGRADLHPAWSPDGRQIAYTSGQDVPSNAGSDIPSLIAGRQIQIATADGTERRTLPASPEERNERPRWSVDGRQILFVRVKDGQVQLWTTQVDGANQHMVVDRLGAKPAAAQQEEDWTGYYGHVDWDKEYDWWQPPVSPAPERTPPPPVQTVTAVPATQDLTDPEFRVSLHYPGHWQPLAGYPRLYGGDDGFVQIGVLGAEALTASQTCVQLAAHQTEPYGSRPTVEPIQVDGREACLVMPSVDQDPSRREAALAVAIYPRPITIEGVEYPFFVLHADQAHLREIAGSVRFADQAAADTSHITYREPSPDGRMLTMDEAKERVAIFLGEAPGELEGTYRDTPGMLPAGDFRPAYYFKREVQDSRQPDTFTVDAATGEVTEAHLASNWHPPAPKEPIAEAEAQVVAEAFARSRFAGLEKLTFAVGKALTTPPPPGSTDEPYRSYDAVWNLRAADSGAILPTGVTVQVDLDTGRVAVYWSSRLAYNGPTLPTVSRDEAERIALAESTKVEHLAGATVLRSQLSTVLAFEGRRLAWQVYLAVPESEDTPHFSVDAITGEVLNPVGSSAG